MFDAIKVKFKELLMKELVKLDEMVLNSKNKIDDMVWAQVRIMIVNWIAAL